MFQIDVTELIISIYYILYNFCKCMFQYITINRCI